MILRDWEFSFRDFLFGADHEFGIVDIEGLAPTDYKEDIVDKASDHGAFIKADYMTYRRVTVTGDFHSATDFENKLNKLRTIFTPTSELYPLDFRLGSDITKRIYCKAVKCSFPINPMYSIGYMRWTVQFLAPSPLIFDASQRVASTGPLTITSGIGFDADFDVDFGGIATFGKATVVNEGIIDIPFEAKITGPALRPRITNLRTNKTIALNIYLRAGQYIDLDSHEKTILLNGSSSRYNSLDKVDSWWSIKPGTQEIQFFAESSTVATTLDFKWRSGWV